MIAKESAGAVQHGSETPLLFCDPKKIIAQDSPCCYWLHATSELIFHKNHVYERTPMKNEKTEEIKLQSWLQFCLSAFLEAVKTTLFTSYVVMGGDLN